MPNDSASPTRLTVAIVGVALAAATALAAGMAGTRERPKREGTTNDDARPSEGELHVRVVDADTELPMLARVVVRPLGLVTATRVLALRRGDSRVRLPVGRYRVSAGRGIEWSLDAADIDVAEGRTTDVELHPRHVVQSDGLVAADLHIQPQASHDDQLVSVAATGIELGVVMDRVGHSDYRPALSRTELDAQLVWLSGVEIVTPATGPFGVLPAGPATRVTPAAGASASDVFRATRATADGRRIIVIHDPRGDAPRGYFDTAAFDASAPALPTTSFDFDVLELYTARDLADPTRVDRLLRDWFSLLDRGKRIAVSGSAVRARGGAGPGVPQTYLEIGAWRQGYAGGPPDLDAIFDAVRGGHGFVTSGPAIDFTIAGEIPNDTDVNKGLGTVLSARQPGQARPGTTVRIGSRVDAHIRVRAPSWVEVSTIEVVAGGDIVHRIPLANRPLSAGREPGTIAEARARATRFDANVSLSLARTTRWILVIARGERADEDAIPGIPVRPFAVTNPIWLEPPPRGSGEERDR